MVEVLIAAARDGTTAYIVITSKIAAKMHANSFKFFIVSLLISYSPLFQQT
jgi:hypothetical protein